MKQPQKQYFFAFYFLVTLTAAIASEWHFRYLLLFSKPFLTVSLLVFLFSSSKEFRLGSIVAALLLSLSGDIFLMFDNMYPTLFLPGLFSFLCVHVCYFIFFIKNINHTRPWNQHWTQLAAATLILVYVVEFYVINHEAFRELGWETLLYVAAIGVMGVSAAFRDKVQNPKTYYKVLAGALFFILSDSLLAINKFVNPFEFANLLVLLTYGVAQFLLITGISEFVNSGLLSAKKTVDDVKKSH